MSIFGKSFEPFLKDQINIRQNINGKISRNINDIKYINGRKPWIKMASSVNFLTNTAVSFNIEESFSFPTKTQPFPNPLNFTPKFYLESEYSPEMAQKYILFGGILDAQGRVRGGINNDKELYSLKTPLGTPHVMGRRPMPGITSINVETIGAYGSLRKAVVNFVCWDIKQLEELEPLYMRPGYQVLLEWGWTPYIDNNNNLNNSINSYTDKIENGKNAFFSNGNKNSDEINKELFNKTKLSGGNYGGFFGVVENFSWESRDDGGYNCRTIILSVGEVLESLKVNYIPNNIPVNLKGVFEGAIINKNFEAKDITDKDIQNIDKAYFGYNILYGLMYEIRTTIEKFPNNDITEKFIRGFLNLDDQNGEDHIINYCYNTQNLSDINPNLDTGLPDRSKNIYITLKSLLNVFNTKVFPKNSTGKNIISFSTKERNYLDEYINGKKLNELECIADPLQISVDPSVCIIKNPTWTKSDLFSDVEGLKISNLEYLNSLEYSYINPDTGNGIISNIYINLRYLENTFLSFPTDNNGDINLYDSVKSILLDIEASMGYINKFDIFLDPIEGNIARIIDKNFTSQNKDNVQIIEVNKRNSFVKNYRLSSQIFPEQSSIIAISAQALPNEFSSNTLMSFNENIINRFNHITSISLGRKNNKSNLGLQKCLLELNEYFNDLSQTFKSETNVVRTIKGENFVYFKQKDGKKNNLIFADYKNVLKELLNIKRNLNKGKDGKNYPDIIPTKLTLEIDGIGGFIIGNIFNISPEFIPEFYKVNNKNVQSNYIITSYSDEINESTWNTSLGAQTILINKEDFQSNNINNIIPGSFIGRGDAAPEDIKN